MEAAIGSGGGAGQSVAVAIGDGDGDGDATKRYPKKKSGDLRYNIILDFFIDRFFYNEFLNLGYLKIRIFF